MRRLDAQLMSVPYEPSGLPANLAAALGGEIGVMLMLQGTRRHTRYRTSLLVSRETQETASDAGGTREGIPVAGANAVGEGYWTTGFNLRIAPNDGL
jgi:hypothetical protein